MSSFNTTINSNGQFIIAIKIIKSPGPEEYQKWRSAKSKRALIDTGASRTCIAQECADELGLISIGKAIINTASGDCEVHNYKIDLAIPVTTAILQPIEKEDGQRSMESVVIGETHWAHAQHTINSIPAVEKDRGFDVILGMDILSQMHITMFKGSIIMSF